MAQDFARRRYKENIPPQNGGRNLRFPYGHKHENALIPNAEE
jgi:hypothetical protein